MSGWWENVFWLLHKLSKQAGLGIKRIYLESYDEGGLAWDDTSNNRAFLSGSISATNNGASIYIEAKRKPDSYQTEKGVPQWLNGARELL